MCEGIANVDAKAFLVASNERGLFDQVRESVCAMLFFATPHSGSGSEFYTDILCNVADAMLFPTLADKLLDSFRTSVLENFRSNTKLFSKLADTFQSGAYAIPQISSFVEKSPLPGAKAVVRIHHSLGFFPSP